MKFKFIDNATIPFDVDEIFREFNVGDHPDYKAFYFKRFQGATVIIDLSALNPSDGDSYFFQCDRGTGSTQNYWLRDANRSLEIGASKTILAFQTVNGLTIRDLLIGIVFSSANNCWLHFAEPTCKAEFGIYSGYHWVGGGN